LLKFAPDAGSRFCYAAHENTLPGVAGEQFTKEGAKNYPRMAPLSRAIRVCRKITENSGQRQTKVRAHGPQLHGDSAIPYSG
jgi:hypothetical protein